MSVLPPEIIFRILREANCDSPKSISKELSSHTEIFLSLDYPISKREINENNTFNGQYCSIRNMF